jgi:hypothetical protein
MWDRTCRFGGSSAKLLYVTEPWTPELVLHTADGRCRLSLVGVTYGSGATLQEAGNDLLVKLFDLATAFRDGRFLFTSEFGGVPLQTKTFLWEIGEIAASGGDLRSRVFGIPEQRSSREP